MPIRDWYRGVDPAEPTARYAETWRQHGEGLVQILDAATVRAVQEQDRIGIDVPSEGEVRRENHVHYHCRHLPGIDFEALNEQEVAGIGPALLPTITGPVRAEPAPFLVRDWQVAQSATRRPVKITVPGPLTIGEWVVDRVYEGDMRRRGAALADSLNMEIRRLADAGCPWIQLDEPAFVHRPAAAVAFGIEHLERCFHRVPREVTRAVHICSGCRRALDAEDGPSSPAEAYAELADPLDDAALDAVSIEDARHPNDLALLERFRRTTVILGVIDVGRSRIEDMEEIRDRLRAACEHIDPHRLLAAPDCGLGPLTADLARRKLEVLVAAARDL